MSEGAADGLEAAWDYVPGPTALDGRNILISGATGALGSALATACAAAGATTILVGRNVAALESLYDRIESAGGPQPAILPVDFAGAAPGDYRQVSDALSGPFARLDGLAHVAGTLGQLSPATHLDPAQWQRTVAVNLQAPLLLTQACFAALGNAPDASVVFALDAKTRAYWGGYGVAKAGLQAFAQVLADEWEENGPRVNAVDPGPMRSGLRRAAYPAEDPRRLADAGQRVAPFLYLLGADCRGASGKLLRFGAPPATLASAG